MTLYAFLYQPSRGRITLSENLYQSHSDAMEAARKWFTVWHHYDIDETENGFIVYTTDWASVFSTGERISRVGDVEIISFNL